MIPEILWETVGMLILCYISISDITNKIIPDRGIAALGLWGMVWLILSPEGTVISHLAGMAAVSVPMFAAAMVFPGSFGGGDIKLMAVAGLIMGIGKVLCAFCAAVCFAAVYSLYLLTCRRKSPKEIIAFGPFLCIGIVTAHTVGDQVICWFLS